MKITEPTIIEREPQPYAGIVSTTTMQSIGPDIGAVTGEVFQRLAAQGIAPVGPPFWKYNLIDMAGEMEVEAGVPVAGDVTDDDRLAGRVLPGGRYVTLHHTGHPSTLIDATKVLLEWAEEHDLKFDVDASDRWGARLEIYHSDPDEQPDMNKWETDLAFRLAD